MTGLNCEIGWKTRLCQVGDELGQFHIWEQWSNVVIEAGNTEIQKKVEKQIAKINEKLKF